MPNFWTVVNRVIRDTDLILFVLDARYVEKTRNQELEARIKLAGKPILFVINKSDLIELPELKRIKKEIGNAVFVSSKDFLGQTKLRDQINRLREGKDIIIGVVGYPNVGKSSVINMLAQKGVTGMSPTSNFTRGKQLVRLTEHIQLMDTPGVLAYEEKDEVELAKIGARSFDQLKDPILVAFKLIDEYKARVLSFYQVSPAEVKGMDEEEILEFLAKKRGCMQSGGKPDPHRMSTEIIRDWQSGKI